MASQDEILAGLLGGIPGGPLTKGLLATSAGLLAGGGPSYEPRSLGSALGTGMMSGLNAYQQAQQSGMGNYMAAQRLAQQMRQQQALSQLTAGMSPQMQALAAANPEAFTRSMADEQLKQSEFQRRVKDYQAGLSSPDPVIREAAVSNLAQESPWLKAQVAGLTERARFNAVTTPELAARAGAEAGARARGEFYAVPDAARAARAGAVAGATAAGNFYGAPQRVGDSFVSIPPPGSTTQSGQPATPRVVYDAPQSGEKTASMEDGLRKEFDGRYEVKGFKDVSVAYSSAITAGDNKAGDLNIVYALAKTFDPGSVVREGESLMVVNAANLPQQVQGMINYVAGGGRLGPSQRAQLFNELNIRAKQWQGLYDTAYSQAADIAQRRSLNVKNVLPERIVLPEYKAPPPPPEAPPPKKSNKKGDAVPNDRRPLPSFFKWN